MAIAEAIMPWKLVPLVLITAVGACWQAGHSREIERKATLTSGSLDVDVALDAPRILEYRPGATVDKLGYDNWQLGYTGAMRRFTREKIQARPGVQW